jgi:CDP-glucose 4,6-dehydratase
VPNEIFSIKNLEGPILVTGHSGFKGTWLTLLLEEVGIPVIGFSLPPLDHSLYARANRFGKIPEVFGDVQDLILVKDTFKKFQPKCVIHMAAQPLVLDSYDNPIGTFQTNVMGTANVLEVATTTESVRTIACITTDKVYANKNEQIKFSEEDKLGGKDPYSASKVASESVIDAWRNLSVHRNQADVLSFRSGNVIGGGDYSNNRLLPDIIRNIFLGEPLSIRNPAATRPWQHVLDPLFGYLLGIAYSASETSPGLNTFNFGPTEDSLSVSDVVQIADDYCLRFSLPKTAEVIPESLEAVSLQLNSSRANSVLGWAPRLTQRQAVTATIDWWVENLEKSIPAEELCKGEIRKFLAK